MPKKGLSYNSPPKQFRIPADLPPLQGTASMITNAMRDTHKHRMANADRAIGTGRMTQSKRGKPGRKKG